MRYSLLLMWGLAWGASPAFPAANLSSEGDLAPPTWVRFTLPLADVDFVKLYWK